jgi:Tfp pilus assembly protein PilO
MSFISSLGRKITSPNTTSLAIPLVFIIVLLFLSFYGGSLAYREVRGNLNTLKEAQKNEKILEQKLSILEELKKGILDQADSSIIALPDKNPGLWAMAHLKSSAQASSLTLSNNKLAQSVSGEDLSQVEFSSSVNGELASLINFLKGISNLAPVQIIDKVDLTRGTDGKNVTASLKLSFFYFPLPTKLSQLMEPIKELTAAEKELLNKVAGFTRPEFTTLTPSMPEGRDNPFQ